MNHHPHPGGHSPDAPRHNMMVVGEKSIFLSHLPMFMPPHNFQVILEATFTKQGNSADEIYFADRRRNPGTKMYTLQPEVIKLPSLFAAGPSGPILRSFKGTVFRGHLERGGQAMSDLTDIDVNIKRVIYAEKFGPGLGKSEQLEYLLFGSGQELFLSHVIAAPPDFDQLLSVRINPSPTQEEINAGVRVAFLNRANSAAQRIREKAVAQGQGHVTGAHQFLDLPVEAGVEFYFEEGELSSPAVFAPTPEEIKSGFGD